MAHLHTAVGAGPWTQWERSTSRSRLLPEEGRSTRNSGLAEMPWAASHRILKSNSVACWLNANTEGGCFDSSLIWIEPTCFMFFYPLLFSNFPLPFWGVLPSGHKIAAKCPAIKSWYGHIRLCSNRRQRICQGDKTARPLHVLLLVFGFILPGTKHLRRTRAELLFLLLFFWKSTLLRYNLFTVKFINKGAN